MKRGVFITLGILSALLAGCGESGPPDYVSTARLMLDGVGGISGGAMEAEVKLLESEDFRLRLDGRMQGSHPDYQPAAVELKVEDSIKTASIKLDAIGKNPTMVEAFLKTVLAEYFDFRKQEEAQEKSQRSPVRVVVDVTEPTPLR